MQLCQVKTNGNFGAKLPVSVQNSPEAGGFGLFLRPVVKRLAQESAVRGPASFESKTLILRAKVAAHLLPSQWLVREEPAGPGGAWQVMLFVRPFIILPLDRRRRPARLGALVFSRGYTRCGGPNSTGISEANAAGRLLDGADECRCPGYLPTPVDRATTPRGVHRLGGARRSEFSV